MWEPFCPQHGFLRAALIVRIEEGDDIETLSDHEGRAIHNRRALPAAIMAMSSAKPGLPDRSSRLESAVKMNSSSDPATTRFL
jgi:hypothetical protein